MSDRFWSNRFWLGSAGALAIAALAGVGVGSYVTSPQQRATASADAALVEPGQSVPTGSTAQAATDMSPGEIHCSGCGPTLAQRRMDSAGLEAGAAIDTSLHTAEKDYLSDTEVRPSSPPAPAPIRLPANIERFASGTNSAATSAPVTRATVQHVPPPVSVPALNQP